MPTTEATLSKSFTALQLLSGKLFANNQTAIHVQDTAILILCHDIFIPLVGCV